jgi:hypothetical protein
MALGCWASAAVLLLCACGPPPPIRLQSPPLAIYGAFKPATRTPTVRHAANDIEITVEEFVTADKAREVFDADLAGYGVLALFITLVNNGVTAYEVERGAISAFVDAQPLPLLAGREAAAQSTAPVFEQRLMGQDAAYAFLALNPAGLVVLGSYWLDCLGNAECGFNKERERRRDAIGYDRAHIPLQFEKPSSLTLRCRRAGRRAALCISGCRMSDGFGPSSWHRSNSMSGRLTASPAFELCRAAR